MKKKNQDNVYEIVEIDESTRVKILVDPNPESPFENGEPVGDIAYMSSSRLTLGSEKADQDRLDEISLGIRNGSLIGMPVYAYVHGVVSIACGTRLDDGTYVSPFNCQWDSGQSGFVYVDKETAIMEFGNKIMTAVVKEKTLKYLASEVNEFDQYLQGQVYGLAVESLEDGEWTEDKDELRVWGIYGIEAARSEALSMGGQSNREVESTISPRG